VPKSSVVLTLFNNLFYSAVLRDMGFQNCLDVTDVSVCDALSWTTWPWHRVRVVVMVTADTHSHFSFLEDCRPVSHVSAIPKEISHLMFPYPLQPNVGQLIAKSVPRTKSQYCQWSTNAFITDEASNLLRSQFHGPNHSIVSDLLTRLSQTKLPTNETTESTNQPTKKLTKGGVLRKRQTSSVARFDHSCVRNALLEMVKLPNAATLLSIRKVPRSNIGSLPSTYSPIYYKSINLSSDAVLYEQYESVVM
jgi:hypothetical protein